jgi:hypothetical protein
VTWWSAVFVALIGLTSVTILVWGTTSFSATRARNVKYAEREHRVIEHIVEVQRAHTEIIKVHRADRHPYFVLLHVGLLGYSVCIFTGALPTDNVSVLADGTRLTMSVCFLIGSGLVLMGASLGVRLGRWRISPATANHLTASVLGDDIVLPYRLSMAGMGAVSVSTTIYAFTSFQTTAGSVGGWLSAVTSVACYFTIPWFYRAVSTFQKWDVLLISEAMIRAGIGDDHDTG